MEIAVLSQVDVESQVALVVRALNSYEQKQKLKLLVVNYGEPHLVSLIVINISIVFRDPLLYGLLIFPLYFHLNYCTVIVLRLT